MEDIVITNTAGESIYLGRQGPFFLEKIEGVSEVAVCIESQKAPYQDGATYIDNTLAPRALNLEGLIITKGDDQALVAARRRMQRVLNPKGGAIIISYRQRDQAKEIKGIAETTPVFPSGPGNRGPYYQRFLLQLVCHQPFWMDSLAEEREIVTWIGGLIFPWTLPTRFALKGRPVINIVNKGDVKTPVQIEFRGPATNPKIINQTRDEYLQVRQELAHGDVLVIKTDFGGKQVEINGINAFHWIDPDSSFWQLQPGDNIVEYTSDEPTEPAAVVISYRNRYVGV